MIYKKIITGALAVTLTFGAVGLPAAEGGLLSNGISASAAYETYGDFEYNILDDGTVSVLNYAGEDENITIPSEINGKPVTSIATWTFCDCTSLKSVTIPNSVTNIGQTAFDGCTNLTSVTIPNSVTSIGYSAFSNCTSLTSVTIPNSVTSIEDYTFSYCTSLTRVTIPNSVTSIGENAFSNCTSLISITLPDSLTSIEYAAFGNCTSLTSVTIPNSVTSIEKKAFGYNWNPISANDEKIPDFTINCYAGSVGEKYAKENGFNYHAHTFNNWTTTKASTCTATGIKTRKCSCGKNETQVIPKTAHKVKTVPGKAATCTKAGYTSSKVCAHCGKVLQAKKTIKATGKHVYKTVKVVKPTYTSNGYTLKKCACGKTVKTNIKPKLVLKNPARVITVGQKKKAVIKWSAVKNATGYKVWMKTSKNGTYKPVKALKGRRLVKSGLNSGKTYYFAVKAYKKIGNKYVFSKATYKTVKVK